MKLAIVKIIFKDGSIGYFKNDEVITPFKDQAFKCDANYANGLCRGLNFAIQTYDDALTDRAEVELL